MPTIERRGPAVDYSVFNWLKTVEYTVAAVTGTIDQHHGPDLGAIIWTPAYPSDLVQMRQTTLAVAAPQDEVRAGDQFFGDDQNADLYTGAVHGFVVTALEDRRAKFAMSRLMNDIRELLDKVAAEEGIPLLDAVTPHASLGEMVVTAATARSLPVNAPEVPADRYKFIVEFEIELV